MQRVASHALAAITNFAEEVDKELTAPFLEPILKKTVQLMQRPDCCSLIKENAVSTIAALAESAKDNFHPYCQQILDFLFTFYNSHADKCYRQLRGQTIECITLIAHSVSREVFKPYFPQITNILINLQISGVLEAVDPQKPYILSGWQRLSLIFKEEMEGILPQMLPSLYKLIKSIFEAENSPDADIAKSYDAEEAEIAIHMIQSFVEQLREGFQPYVGDTIELVKPLCLYTKNDGIRTAACKFLPSLLGCLKC